jgi:hypothetical protein
VTFAPFAGSKIWAYQRLAASLEQSLEVYPRYVPHDCFRRAFSNPDIHGFAVGTRV